MRASGPVDYGYPGLTAAYWPFPLIFPCVKNEPKWTILGTKASLSGKC